MSVVHFPAIIEGGEKAGFSVYFPDLPGLASAGATISEAIRRAEEALQLHLDGMKEDGEAVPTPTPHHRIPDDPIVRVAARILVPARA